VILSVCASKDLKRELIRGYAERKPACRTGGPLRLDRQPSPQNRASCLQPVSAAAI
jgi:hypothetical protein